MSLRGRAARRPRVLMALMFFPRGGSAQVARSLGRELPAHGWDVTVLSGSLAQAGRHGDARDFYEGLDVRPVDYPLPIDPPLHPSYEDRPGAPDPVFAAVEDAAYERLVEFWAGRLQDAGAAQADVLHLHHLTPINEAAARVAPDVPVIGGPDAPVRRALHGGQARRAAHPRARARTREAQGPRAAGAARRLPGGVGGRHPAETIDRWAAADVFLAGWHAHAGLPDFFAAADVVVLPSVREQFGQVLVEGMACGLPAIAVDKEGPADIVADGEAGWLVEPDDELGLARAIEHAVNDPAERARRGDAAWLAMRERYAWPALAGRVAELYASVRLGPVQPY